MHSRGAIAAILAAGLIGTGLIARSEGEDILREAEGDWHEPRRTVKPPPPKPQPEPGPMTRQQRRAAEREALKASPHKRWNQGKQP